MNYRTEKLIQDLRRASARTPEQKERDAAVQKRINSLITCGEISMDELNRGVLRAVLKVYGRSAEVPHHGNLVRLPEWSAGLFTNPEVSNFFYVNGPVDRPCYDQLARNAGIVHCSKLLRDLTASGQLDLVHPSMSGIVAAAWTSGEPGSASCIEYSVWLKLFRLNGFTVLGERAPRPSDFVTVYRGCPYEHRFGMAWSTQVKVARRFATERMSGRPLGEVYVANVAPDHLLAFIEDGLEEHEWVINPAGLDDTNVHPLEPEPSDVDLTR